MMPTHEDAVELLAWAPVCTDAVVKTLDARARGRRDPAVLSDLAAAHLVRAGRQDRPSDYVHALAAAEAALQLDRSLVPARFNAALAAEGLGFLDEALALWTSLGREAPAGWRDEAETHAKRLRAEQARGRAVQWRLNAGRLRDAIASSHGDPKALADLIDPFRASAQNHIEEELLRDWSRAAAEGNRHEAEEKLLVAEAIASVLSSLNKDRYIADAVARIRNERDAKTIAALQEGHRELANARKRQRDLGEERPQLQYERAERAFTRARSPLRFGAALGRITALTQARQFDAAWDGLRTIEREARRSSYHYLLARVHTARGYYFVVKGSHLQSLAEYDTARAIYEASHDVENLANVHSRTIGLYLEIGDLEGAWRQIGRTGQYASSADTTTRHVILGESARAAVEAEEAGIGLRYQDAAVRMLQDELPHTAEQFVPQVRRHLGIALRARASIRAHAGDVRGASVDLAEATRLIGDFPGLSSSVITNGYQARLAEARAHIVAPKNRPEAIRLLTLAIERAAQTHYRTLLASLLLQRAELYRRDRNGAAELSDVQEAVAALRAEAGEILKSRTSVQVPLDVRLWSAYLSRPQEPYRRLVRLLAERGDMAAAFDRAEEARVYEPAHVVLQRADLPSAFTEWLKDRTPLTLDLVKQTLPEGTYLLQYAVLDDRTILWIVRRGAAEWHTLPVGNEQIAAWTSALQQHADRRDDERFRAALAAPYAALFERALERVAEVHPPGSLPRIVIVPDRAMHGLPFSALGRGNAVMIERHRLSVAGSATFYAFSLDRDRELATRAPESVLIVGDPAFAGDPELTRGLQQSVPGLSIGRIRQIYARLLPVQPLVRGDATVPKFLDLAARSTVIHLAAHGVANPEVPSRSFFMLAPAENDRGALDAERLLRELRLQNARLAVLAACSSAGGTSVGPEGLAPLVRPLVIAGVPGVIGTLWNVSAQQETEELLVRFHRHYSAGTEAGDALRLAQLEMRSDPDASRNTPRAWGAFQMIGHASSPFHASTKQTRR
jgi:CHAT domain-containing protein